MFAFGLVLREACVILQPLSRGPERSRKKIGGDSMGFDPGKPKTDKERVRGSSEDYRRAAKVERAACAFGITIVLL
jgi:hypothetical protein